MPVIYLRVPPYVAAFYRHKDEKKPLSEWDPVVFDNFSFEMQILRRGVCSDKTRRQTTVLCYSQQSWKNICSGKLPIGGKVVFRREQKSWPSCRELVALEGRSMKPNEELFDYLCIQLPSEVMIGDQVMKTDSSCSMEGPSAQRLSNVLRDEFYHYFYEWTDQEMREFRKKKLEMTKAEAMERFYAQYEIPMPKWSSMQNTMRVMLKRLFDRAKAAKNRRTEMQGEYFSYVGSNNKKIPD